MTIASHLTALRRNLLGSLPLEWQQAIIRRRHPPWWGVSRRLAPLTVFGFGRGIPVDRHYIDAFIARHRSDISGRVLEVREPLYARNYMSQIAHLDIVDINPDLPDVTLVADLQNATGIDNDTYDCVILTQTLHLMPDVVAALREVQRILRPGGVVLCTVPCTSRLDPEDPQRDHWRFTPAGARYVFSQVFGQDVDVRSCGNLLATVAFLRGLAVQDVRRTKLDIDDTSFPLIVCVRARKQRPSPDD